MTMYRLIIAVVIAAGITACSSNTSNNGSSLTAAENNAKLDTLLKEYWNKRMELLPIEATINGDNRFNDKLYADFTDSYQDKLYKFFAANLDSVKLINRDSLNETNKASYDIFKREMEMSIEGLTKYQHLVTGDYVIDSRIPFQQYWGLPLSMGQMGSGSGNQPF